MKTSKILTLATIVAFVMLSFSTTTQVEASHSKTVVNISFADAIQDAGLVVAMYTQLNPGFLNVNQAYYTQSVYYQGVDFRITGTYSQWKTFFKYKIVFGTVDID